MLLQTPTRQVTDRYKQCIDKPTNQPTNQPTTQTNYLHQVDDAEGEADVASNMARPVPGGDPQLVVGAQHLWLFVRVVLFGRD